MRAKVILCFVSLLSASLAYTPRKSCNDCIGYKSCEAAVILINKKEPAADAELKSAFCGFDGARLPMIMSVFLPDPTSLLPEQEWNLNVAWQGASLSVVLTTDRAVCCSELSGSPPPTSDGIENHPNLRLLPEMCGKINGDKILGGNTTGLYDYPWMALISYKTRLGLQFECGGSLINERYVLTAAHCIANLKLAGVRIGENDVDTTTDCQGEPPTLTCESNIQDLRIEEAIAHPEYHGKPAIRNDIGLLRLKKPVNLAFKNAGIICLPVTRNLQNRNIGGLHATVAGWGYTEKGYVSSKLLAVEVPIHTAESCRELYNRGRKPGDEDETINKICAGQNGKDSCGGDSGGPLMVKGAYRNIGERYIQHGIVSYGPRLCGSDFPGVYTDVAKYMKWILDTIRP